MSFGVTLMIYWVQHCLSELGSGLMALGGIKSQGSGKTGDWPDPIAFKSDWGRWEKYILHRSKQHYASKFRLLTPLPTIAAKKFAAKALTNPRFATKQKTRPIHREQGKNLQIPKKVLLCCTSKELPIPNACPNLCSYVYAVGLVSVWLMWYIKPWILNIPLDCAFLYDNRLKNHENALPLWPPHFSYNSS